MKIFIVTLVLTFSVMPCSVRGQEEPKAILVDEFRNITCEHLLALTDAFMQDLVKEPSARALIITFPKKGRIMAATARQTLIISRFQLSGLEGRVSFVTGEEREDIKTEFWKTSAGATEPTDAGTKWIEPRPDLTKPFIFGFEDENGICPTFVPRKYAELILANPGSRAHFVVSGGGKYSRNRVDFAREWLDTLTKEVKISRNRIRVFYAKKGDGLTGAEFWFVPARK